MEDLIGKGDGLTKTVHYTPRAKKVIEKVGIVGVKGLRSVDGDFRSRENLDEELNMLLFSFNMNVGTNHNNMDA